MRDSASSRTTPRECSNREDLAHLNLIGESPTWRATLRLVVRIACTEAVTLIEGETGTGKELVARAIHYLGRRRDFPFIPLNCGALPESLLEAELFGHERGAFTDARERRAGLVAEADGGTLFLDEVEAMSPRAQVVLLRFVQDRTYLPVGGRVLATSDARIVAASNADLEEEVARGRFRRDLLFRLRVLHVRLPPLRERTGDVALLSAKFLDRLGRIHGRPHRRLSAMSLAALEAHNWPGNVRELESLILRELLLQEDDDQELTICSRFGGGAAPPFPPDFKRAKARAVAEFETAYLRQLLSNARGNMSLAARLAHADRSALNRLAKKHGIRPSEFRANAPP